MSELQKQRVREACTKHGLYQSPEYQVWKAMISRCTRPNHPSYKDYGARGITVVSQWFQFAQFIADMGRRPSPKHTLERKDNDGGYTPSNCIWATRTEQQRNRRCNRYITVGDTTRCMSEWCDILGINEKSVSYRVRHGWDPIAALMTPLEKNKPKRKDNK